jgi:predicted O-linked N-acetylglucosamine transferase (SPINDLY family)
MPPPALPLQAHEPEPAADVEAMLQEALARHGRGDIDGACLLYDAALQTRPEHPLALHNLGVLRAAQGRRMEAIELIRRAAQADPGSAPAHANLGALLLAEGLAEEAEPCFFRAVLADPTSCAAACGLADVQAAQGRHDEAEKSYRRALELDGKYTPAMTGLGIALMRLNRVQEAGDLFCQALVLQPSAAPAHYNVANALKASGRLEEAAIFYREALQLDPSFADAWTNLGNLMRALEDEAQALACHKVARDLRPADPRAHLNLGQIYKDRGEVELARAELNAASMLDPSDVSARLALCMAELPMTYTGPDEIVSARARYAERLEALIADYERTPRPEAFAAAIGSSQPFYLAYQGRNDRELQARYGAFVCKVMADHRPLQQALPLPQPGERIKVGVVSGFFRAHSNWKIPIRGWLKGLDRSRFEVVGYYTGAVKDACTDEAEGLCDRFVSGMRAADAWRDQILADGPHVLIYPEVGMDPMSARLAAQRLAAVQCASWGHPDTTGLPTMDAYLSSELMEPEGAQDHYCEPLVRLPGLGVLLEEPRDEAEEVSRADLGLKDDALVFWCAQSLPKYLPEHDDLYVRIAEALPRAQFVFIGLEHASEAQTRFLSRMQAAFARRGLDFADHGVMLPRLTKARFLGALRQADVLLDSPGWSGCNSTLESLGAGLPIVTMEAQLMRGRHTAAILKLLGLERLIARDGDGFVATALGLGADAGLRRRIGDQIAQRKARLYGDGAPIRALEQMLIGALEERRAGRERH